ncbi:MAG: YciI family protein [Bacteroidota bacterium]
MIRRSVFLIFLFPFVWQLTAAQNMDDMTMYVMGFLKKGPAWSSEKTPDSEILQNAHLTHLDDMERMGKLVGAGPITSEGDLRGILIFKADSVAEVQELAMSDPAVKAGQLALELHPWFALKGIGAKYFEWAKENPAMQVPMKKYQFGLLVRGEKWTPERTPEVEKIQEGHMANINRLAEEKKLVLAGPFTDGGYYRGVFIFAVNSLEEANELTGTDPAVKAGRLKIELHEWMSAEGVIP